MRRILSLITALALVFCLCGCSKGGTLNSGENGGTAVSGKTVSLAYNATDSFNPYAAKSQVNRLISTLIYDSLIKIDENYEPVYVLAESISVSGNVCTVKIKSALFTDSSVVTADDVVYSFNAAKNAGGRYAAMLAGITAVEKTDSSTVKFICKKNDPYIANLLTFPIIKVGTDNLKNEDNISLPPTGSGRYILDSARECLKANPTYYGGEPQVKTIRLIDAQGSEALSHVIDIGAIDMYYTDLSDCNILRMSGERTNVRLNNLVFVGVNLNNPQLDNSYLRQALSAAINRAKICEDAYFTSAVPATGVFNPAWQAISSMQTILSSPNLNITIENLNKIGYNSKSTMGYFVNSSGKELSFSLLVNEENQFRGSAADMIAVSLKAAGINVTVERVPFSEYQSRLSSGRFDLYLGETNILDNMDISALLCNGGSMAYGLKKVTSTATGENGEAVIQAPDHLEAAINAFYTGNGTIKDIAAIAISEMPIIPICYRMGILFCSDNIGGVTTAYESDIYAVLK